MNEKQIVSFTKGEKLDPSVEFHNQAVLMINENHEIVWVESCSGEEGDTLPFGDGETYHAECWIAIPKYKEVK